MAISRHIARPNVSELVQWEGNNIAEFELVFGRTFTVNEDGSLNDVNGYEHNIPLNYWYEGLGVFPTNHNIGNPNMMPVSGIGPYNYLLEEA